MTVTVTGNRARASRQHGGNRAGSSGCHLPSGLPSVPTKPALQTSLSSLPRPLLLVHTLRVPGGSPSPGWSTMKMSSSVRAMWEGIPADEGTLAARLAQEERPSLSRPWSPNAGGLSRTHRTHTSPARDLRLLAPWAWKAWLRREASADSEICVTGGGLSVRGGVEA